MKKGLLAILVLVIIIGLCPKKSFAQTFDANKAYQDYQYSLDVYNQANTTFENAKDFHLKNKTLTLKEDARKKLLTMLRDRDQLESVYLTALRIKMLETNSSVGNIESEIEWYKNHMNNYKDSDPTEDLFNKNSEVESRYKTNTSPIIYEALFTISLGEEMGLREQHEAIYTQLKALIKNTDFFDRWFTDIDSTVQTLKQNEELAKTQIQKMYGQNEPNLGSYNTAIEILDSSIKPLNQLNNFLTEVKTSIKNQQ